MNSREDLWPEAMHFGLKGRFCQPRPKAWVNEFA